MNRVIRSYLFAPANHARRSEKAFQVGADAVILDLEDAVALSEKPAARGLAVAALQRPRQSLGYVRVNAYDTAFCFDDLAAVVAPGVDGIVLPKVERAADLMSVDWIVRQLERRAGLPEGKIDILPIIETGTGLMALEDIARADTRVRRFAFGAGDFTFDMNLSWSRNEEELAYARSRIVAVSRAAGLAPPVDTVWIHLQDHDGMRDAADRAQRHGFQGKLSIHPDQVTIINDVFTPSPAEVAQAERIVAAFAAAEGDGSAALVVDGKFIDYPIVYRAQAVLSTIRAIREQ